MFLLLTVSATSFYFGIQEGWRQSVILRAQSDALGELGNPIHLRNNNNEDLISVMETRLDTHLLFHYEWLEYSRKYTVPNEYSYMYDQEDKYMKKIVAYREKFPPKFYDWSELPERTDLEIKQKA